MNLVELIKAFLSDIRLFSRIVVRRPLRQYQLEPASAIVDSVLRRRGLSFAVVMSRQAGKNELSAQLEAYLMNLHQQCRGAQLVKASPTYKPQTINSKLRLRDCLDNPWNRAALRGDEGYIVRLGLCRAFFFSAHPGANVVGATASVLLECDETQDVDEDKWNKDFVPMGASANVTTVFYGTMWTARTLLARVMRRLREAERADGIQRVFVVPWERVAQEVPAYGVYVQREMQRLGPEHPIIKTQYLLSEIDQAGRLFTAERLSRMRGTHRRILNTEDTPFALAQHPAINFAVARGAKAPAGETTENDSTRTSVRFLVPATNATTTGSNAIRQKTNLRASVRSVFHSPFTLLVDVAGEDEELEGAELRDAEPRRDSTAVTVVRADLSTLDDPGLGMPRYEVVNRYWWTGKKHAELYGAILDLFEAWRAAYIVVDATGVGAGLASFLQRRLGSVRDDPPGAAYSRLLRHAQPAAGGAVLPFVFSQKSKSDLGWAFVGCIESGRFKDYVDDGAADTAQFWREAEACEFEVLPGPGKLLRWGVPDPGHDDLLISAALCACLDRLPWRAEFEGEVIPPDEGVAEERF